MTIEPGSLEHLSELISHVVAPAFLLSAVGSYVSILSSRLMDLVKRIDRLSTQALGHDEDGNSNFTIQRLRRRTALIKVAILLGIVSGSIAVLLIIGSFAAALTGLQHVWIAAGLFILSGLFLFFSLVAYGVDVQISISKHDLH